MKAFIKTFQLKLLYTPDTIFTWILVVVGGAFYVMIIKVTGKLALFIIMIIRILLGLGICLVEV